MESEELRRTVMALQDAGYRAYAEEEDVIVVYFGKTVGKARVFVCSPKDDEWNPN